MGYAFALASALGFSWKAVLAKLAYRTGVDATAVLGLRMAFAFPAYLGMAWFGLRRGRELPLVRAMRARDWAVVALLGVLGNYLSSYLDFVGLTRISAGLERLILFLYPSIVVALGALRAGRRISARELQSMTLGYLGIACVFLGDASGRAPHGPAAWLGVGAVFASSLSYSAYLVFAERVVVRLGSLLFTGVAMSCACVVSLSHFFVLVHDVTQLPGRAVYLCALMALFSTVLPTWLLTEAVRRIGSGRAALCGMIGPITTVVLEITLLDERAGLSDLVGTVLVIGSVAWLTREKQQRAPA